MLLALLALLGFKLKWLMESTGKQIETDLMIRLEIRLARMSELLIWSSLAVFGLSLLTRISIGLNHAISYFEGV